MDDSQVFNHSQSQRAEEWLSHLRKTSQTGGKGKLRVFLGMSAGVGKTFAMLKAAQAELALGRDVVIGCVESHGRQETEVESAKLPVLPRKSIQYKGTTLLELDLDGILTRRPEIVLVDELAHTNAPGSRHPKRYQDVQEILRAGIDVFTTVNVQHLESRADTVASITGVVVRETVPDGLLDEATEIQLIDISPEKLLQRLKEGKVYLGDRRDAAMAGFFKPEHLTALRELALRTTAERVDQDLLAYRKGTGSESTWETNDRILVAAGPNPQGERLIRTARRKAQLMNCSWIVVYVKDGSTLSGTEEKYLERNLSLARELGAEVLLRDDPDRVEGLIRTARERNVTQILLGKPEGVFAFSLRSRWIENLFRKAHDIQITFVPTGSVLRRSITLRTSRGVWTGPKRHYGYAALILLLATSVGFLIEGIIGYFGVGLWLLSTVFGAGLFLSSGAVFVLSIVQAFFWNFFFIEPKFTPWIKQPQDIALCLLFVIAAMVLGTATARLHLREARSRRGELEALAQADLLKLIQDSQDEMLLLQEAFALFSRYFMAQTTALLGGPDGGTPQRLALDSAYAPDDKEISVARWAIENSSEAGRWTDTLRDSEVWCCPLKTSRQTLGVLMLRAEDVELSNSDREVIRTLVGSLALGLERLRLAGAEREAELNRESIRIQRVLLNSISHEIRTPLTSVIGNLELWIDRYRRSIGSDSTRELRNSLEEAREVDRILEDLVSLSRLENQAPDLRVDWVDLDDLVSKEVKKLSHRYPGSNIEPGIGARDYVLVNSDARILSLVTRNLLENAVKHTPIGTRIRVRWHHTPLVGELWVEDAGPGVPPDKRTQIFERFYRGEGAQSVRGLGLGLSIAQGFMSILNGKLRYEDSELGGAAFVLSFGSTEVRDGTVSELPQELS